MAAIFVAAIVPNNLLNAKSMIRYKKFKNNNRTSASYNKWYGRAVTELMEFEEFVKHMANHHCVFGESTIRGVLIEMQICMRELLLEGKAVRLDDLGIFRIGLETSAATTAKEFTTDNIKAVRLNLYLGKRFRAADLYKDAKFREAGKYDGGGDDGGETADTHDEGGNTNGGDTSGGNPSDGGGNMSDGGGSTDDSNYVEL